LIVSKTHQAVELAVKELLSFFQLIAIQVLPIGGKEEQVEEEGYGVYYCEGQDVTDSDLLFLETE
jgi:hypothetical protein